MALSLIRALGWVSVCFSNWLPRAGVGNGRDCPIATYRARDSVRDIDPHRLVRTRHRWYLVAFDVGRGKWRSFRADRVADAHPTGGFVLWLRDGVSEGRAYYAPGYYAGNVFDPDGYSLEFVYKPWR